MISFLSVATRRFATACAAGLVVGALVTAGPALAGVANQGLPGASPTNPLAGMKWGVYRGPLDGLYPAYQQALGANRGLLAKAALAPSVHWLGAWDSDATAGNVAQNIIDLSGGADVLSQLAVFRLLPWEGQACTTLPNASNQGSYKAWINNLARGIGSARVLIILQPDLPFALCQPGHSLASLHLVAYAARVLDNLPHTTVYLDAGAQDYTSVSTAAKLLEEAGVEFARGFSLNDTHADGTGSELIFGQSLSRALAAAHIPGKHFVVNTSQNGQPFHWYFYQHQNVLPPVCANRRAHLCMTFGIPPTTDVANARWRLSGRQRAIAKNLADGYVWVSRPWLNHGFDLQRTLQMARTTPF